MTKKETDEESELARAVRDLIARMDRRSLDNDLWDADDISIFVRLSKKTVQNHYLEKPGFPKPIVLPTGGRRWVAAEVKTWIMRRR
jgi:predicted DNA-binding transcriptional regulator AlpA